LLQKLKVNDTLSLKGGNVMSYTKTLQKIIPYLLILIGSALAAFSITIFFLPNNLIDGGTVGLAMIASRLCGIWLLPYFLLAFNLPFVVLAVRHISRTFLFSLIFAVITFCAFLVLIPEFFPVPFHGEMLEVVVIGGALLGIGIGLIIRSGGCLDGTEILGIIASRNYGLSVGQIVLLCNVVIFSSAGFIFQDWHPALLSLITYFVVVKIMDAVIVGLDETKSVMVMSGKSEHIARAVLHELGLGLTVMYGRGGYSGRESEILYIITERLKLAKLKKLIFSIDPLAFVAIQNLHEVSSGAARVSLVHHKHHHAPEEEYHHVT
jgi:uncharacterized membrane-anchored protein YitT (DUF2179 family)